MAGFGLIVNQIQQRKSMAMGIGLIIAIVVLVVLLGLVGFVIGVYNKLVTMRNRFKNAYAQIDVQLKRRYDLIPNLVEIAKGYIKHERETLENVTKARNIAYAASQAAAANPGDAGTMKNLVSADSGLAGTSDGHQPGRLPSRTLNRRRCRNRRSVGWLRDRNS